MTIKIESYGGEHINTVSTRALKEAKKNRAAVRFDFNEVEVVVSPTDTVDAIVNRWNRDREIAHEKYINSPEYKAAEEKRAADLKTAMAAPMREPAVTEAEMRATQEKWPYTMAQLTEYITSLVDRQHDYGTCVYAMSLAAAAAFYFVSRQLGVTGFQSSCADLDFLRRTRSLKGPFLLLKAEDALYPQSDLSEKLRDALKEWQPWLAEQARERLLKTPDAHPDVLAHWQVLAGTPARES